VPDDLTAARVLAAGLCTAQCLLATGREAAACACPRCRGLLHGALAQVVVRGSGVMAVPAQRPDPDQTDLLPKILELQEATR
jgi:hypothetical protein